MSKSRQIILRIALLAAVGSALMGCQSFRNATGSAKTSPDEFAVLTKAPLIIPPDFNLRPPAPGAPPINQQAPTETAETAMFGSSDPQVVASGITGNFSPAERMLLANAGIQNTDPGVRQELQSDQKSMQGADDSFTDKILYGKPEDNGTPVDADAESSKTKGANRAKDSATTKKSSGGLFDWF